MGEDLQSNFKSDFFATSDCVFDPAGDPTGYNGANVLADVHTEAGKLALPNKHKAYVALLHVSKEGKACIAGVRILAGKPQTGEVCEADSSADQPGAAGMSAMRALRRQQLSRGGTARPQPEPELPPQMQQGGYSQMRQQMPQMQAASMPTMPRGGYMYSQPEPEMLPQQGYHPQMRSQMLPQAQIASLQLQPRMQMPPMQQRPQPQMQQQMQPQMPLQIQPQLQPQMQVPPMQQQQPHAQMQMQMQPQML